MQKYNRIISLVPSQTELLYDLGLENRVVGITKFCVHPDEWFRNKPRIGGTKNIDIEKISSMAPDLVIANREENVKEQVQQLEKKCRVYVSDVYDLPSALKMIGDIGELTDKTVAAEAMIQKLTTLFAALQKSEKYNCCYLIWKDPYMTVGGDTFIDSMLGYVDCKNVFGHLGRYPAITIAEINQSACDFIFLSSEPYPFREKHVKELGQQLTGKIICVDGEMFSWYGSRLLHAATYLRELAAALQQ